MRRRIILIAVGVVAALAISAGAVAFAASPKATGSSSASNPAALTGATWTLTRLEVDGKIGKPATAKRAPTITFRADHQFSGFSGCNSYGGAYVAAGGHLKFGDTAMTLMACVNPDLTTDSDIMSFESDYMLALGRITTYHVSGDTLTLSDGAGKVTMTFRRGG